MQIAVVGTGYVGLVVGGVLAAPLAGLVTRRLQPKLLMIVVGVLVIGLAGWQTWQLLP